MKNRPNDTSNKGFTLVELLVSMAISMIVLGAIVAMFVQYNRVYTLENARANLQQEMRAVMEIMIRDIRMAAVDSANSKDFKIKTNQATRFRFAADLNGNGVLDTGAAATLGCEMISYRYSVANTRIDWICNENTGSADTQPLIGGTTTSGGATEVQVTGLRFEYLNNNNQPESLVSEISGVVITIVAQIPAGRAGLQSRTLSSFVTLRNAGPNSSKS